MRFRKLAGVAAGTLAAGLLTVPAMSGTAQAATAIPGAKFNCDVPAFGAEMDYTTDVSLTIKRTSGTAVSVVAEMTDMPGIVPVPISSMALEAKLSVTLDGAATTLKGSHTATGMAPNAPIALPALSGSSVSAQSTAAVTVTRLEVDAEAMGIPVAVVCTPVAAISGTVPVEGELKPVVKAAKTKSVTKVKLAKNGKKATITTTVKAGKKNATGKVTITVKKGKKVVTNKTVSLKSGKAKLVLKKSKLKAKGKYVVTAKFKGTKNFKKSNAKKTSFKVK